MRNEQKQILNALLKAYEESKTFQGMNKVTQNFSVKPEKIFPAYRDDSQYDVFVRINEAVKDLEDRKIVFVNRLRNGVVTKIILNLDNLSAGYEISDRVPKKDLNRKLYEVWDGLEAAITEKNMAAIFHAYIDEQKERLKNNKKVAYFDRDISDYHMFLQTIYEVLKNDTEQFIRNFSVRLFGNSKKLETMEEKIRSFLYEYGEATSKEDALEEYGIVRTPTNVSVKGMAVLNIGNQILDLSKIQGDITFSTISMAQIVQIKVTGGRIVTVENLTSFHKFHQADSFVIYLGGYHNSIKRNFLKQIYQDNPEKEYMHFGDIDAGGFYIYDHLIKRSGIPFGLLSMDIATLLNHREAWQELTSNDRKRIQALLNKDEVKGYNEVLKFMLEHNCKLEQEAIDL